MEGVEREKKRCQDALKKKQDGKKEAQTIHSNFKNKPETMQKEVFQVQVQNPVEQK